MKKINPYKIYCLAAFHLLVPGKFKQYLFFKTTSAESLAIGVTMTKIKYWRFFIKKTKTKRLICFPNKGDNNILLHD